MEKEPPVPTRALPLIGRRHTFNIKNLEEVSKELTLKAVRENTEEIILQAAGELASYPDNDNDNDTLK